MAVLKHRSGFQYMHAGYLTLLSPKYKFSYYPCHMSWFSVIHSPTPICPPLLPHQTSLSISHTPTEPRCTLLKTPLFHPILLNPEATVNSATVPKKHLALTTKPYVNVRKMHPHTTPKHWSMSFVLLLVLGRFFLLPLIFLHDFHVNFFLRDHHVDGRARNWTDTEIVPDRNRNANASSFTLPYSGY